VHAADLLTMALDFHVENVEHYRAAGNRISTDNAALFRGARSGIVFCAAAVECALSTTIALLCRDTTPRIPRGLLMEYVTTLRDHGRRRDVLRALLPDVDRLFNQREMQELLRTRNVILHAQAEYSEDYVVRPSWEDMRIVTAWSRSLTLPVALDAEWVRNLPRYVVLAVELMERLVAGMAAPRPRLPKMRDDHPIRQMRNHERANREPRRRALRRGGAPPGATAGPKSTPGR